MDSKRLLVISNNGLSCSESNGRVLLCLLNNFNRNNLHSYCLQGKLDEKGIHYIKMNDKRNLLSLFSLGYLKPELLNGCEKIDNHSNSHNKHDYLKKPFFYFVRNLLYSANITICRFLVNYIFSNKIDMIFLFGTDSPFLYKLSRKISQKTKKSLIIYTCEDYPLKNYNYIERGNHNHNLFFRLLLSSLVKQTKKAYEVATKSFFNSDKLLMDYGKKYCIHNAFVKYLPSELNKIDYKSRNIVNVVYGGNIVVGRIQPLLLFAQVLYDIDSKAKLHIYGKINGGNINVFDNIQNVIYHGIVPYNKMIEIYKESDMLLNVEGFDDFHLRDYTHSFSTKIGDCYKLGVPFFNYSPLEIASTLYCLNMNKDYTAISIDDLREKLKAIIISHKPYHVDYTIIKKDFEPFSIAQIFDKVNQ